MEGNIYRMQAIELKEMVKTAIKVAEESCYEAYKDKTPSGDLGMQRYVFQESFKMILAHLLAEKKRSMFPTQNQSFQDDDPFKGMNEPF